MPPQSQSGNHELGRGRGGLGAVYHPGQEHQGQWLRGAYSAGKGVAWRGKREGGGEEEGRVEGAHTQSEKAMNHSRASPTSSPPSSPSKGAVNAEDPRLWGALDHADHASGTCVLVIPCSPSLAPLLLLTLPCPSVTTRTVARHEARTLPDPPRDFRLRDLRRLPEYVGFVLRSPSLPPSSFSVATHTHSPSPTPSLFISPTHRATRECKASRADGTAAPQAPAVDLGDLGAQARGKRVEEREGGREGGGTNFWGEVAPI